MRALLQVVFRSTDKGQRWRAVGHSVALAFALALMSCSSGEAPATATPTKYALRLGHDMPVASAQHVAAVRFAETLRERSGGRITVSLHPAQELGNDHAMIDMARAGELDFIAPPTAKLALVAPGFQVLDLPFMLSDREAREQILDGRVGNTLLEGLDAIDLVGLGLWVAGDKHWTSNQALRTPEDFSGLKFRVMKNEMLRDQFAALGANSVAIDFAQTRDALQSGVVDGQENPLTSIEAMGFHKVQSHLTLSAHGLLAQAFIVSNATLEGLPDDLAALVVEVAAEVTPFERSEAARFETKALEAIRASGTTIVELTDAERERFREATQDIAEKYRHAIGTSLVEQCFLVHQSLRPIPEESLVIGLDADLSGNSALSGLAIRRGIELAMDEINERGGVLGKPLHLHALDNSMVTARGIDNIRSLADIANLVAVVGGISSPVALAEVPIIHEKNVLYLDPWAAATNIVSNGHKPNNVFRLSVRDEFAGEFLVEEALKRTNKVALLLVDNPWGHSNYGVMTRMLKESGLEPSAVEWFSWRADGLAQMMDRVYESGAGAILYVGHGIEAGKIFSNIAERERQIPILSHWGISGSSLPTLMGESIEKLDLQVLQTFSFLSEPRPTEFIRRYGARYLTQSARDIVAPVGTAHAYDLVHILAKAIEQAGSTKTADVRKALENLGTHEGLVKTYEPPFTRERHEALDRKSYILTRYEGSTLVPVGVR